jgi:hypothetical protein
MPDLDAVRWASIVTTVAEGSVWWCSQGAPLRV